jgi:hypothetical protein
MIRSYFKNGAKDVFEIAFTLLSKDLYHARH